MYTTPKFELIAIEAEDNIMMSDESSFNPDKPGLGEEERE